MISWRYHLKQEQIPFAAQASEVMSGTCGANVNWHLADGGMTISGNGAMDDFIVVYVKARAYKKDSTGKRYLGLTERVKKLRSGNDAEKIIDNKLAETYNYICI